MIFGDLSDSLNYVGMHDPHRTHFRRTQVFPVGITLQMPNMTHESQAKAIYKFAVAFPAAEQNISSSLATIHSLTMRLLRASSVFPIATTSSSLPQAQKAIVTYTPSPSEKRSTKELALGKKRHLQKWYQKPLQSARGVISKK